MSAEHQEHSDKNYIKIWFLLLFFLVLSIIGPEFGLPWLTLVTGFGIAVVKAGMVAADYMHLRIEKKIIWLLLFISVIMLSIFYFGVAPDVMNKTGTRWEDCVANNTCLELR